MALLSFAQICHTKWENNPILSPMTLPLFLSFEQQSVLHWATWWITKLTNNIRWQHLTRCGLYAHDQCPSLSRLCRIMISSRWQVRSKGNPIHSPQNLDDEHLDLISKFAQQTALSFRRAQHQRRTYIANKTETLMPIIESSENNVYPSYHFGHKSIHYFLYCVFRIPP